MEINFLRQLDKYAGLVLCAALTVLDRILPKRRPIEMAAVKKCLFMKFWGLGSILLLSPTVQEFKRTYPKAKIFFLTLSRNKDISESLNIFDEVLTLDVDRGWMEFARTLLGVLRYFIRESFDLVVDFEFFTRFSTIMTFMTFAPVKVGYHAWETWRGDIHTVNVPFNRYWHVMDNFYNVCSYIGLQKKAQLKMIKPEIRAEDKEAVHSLLKRHGISNKIVAMHINSSDLAVERRWPRDNFIQLINTILDEHPDVTVIFIGTRSELEMVSEIEKNIRQRSHANFISLLSIRQLAYLFSLSTLVVANDSGPLHLAVAMDVPTVSFFGPETPVVYGPRGKNHVVLFKSLDCSPCINVHDRKSVHCYWERPKCMEAISPEEAYAVISEKLKNEESSAT